MADGERAAYVRQQEQAGMAHPEIVICSRLVGDIARIDVLQMSGRTKRFLWNSGLFTVGSIAALPEGELMARGNIGNTTLKDIQSGLMKRYFELFFP